MLYLWAVGVRGKATSPGPPAPAGRFTGPGVAPAAFRTAHSRVRDGAGSAGNWPLPAGVLRRHQGTGTLVLSKKELPTLQ